MAGEKIAEPFFLSSILGLVFLLSTHNKSGGKVVYFHPSLPSLPFQCCGLDFVTQHCSLTSRREGQ